MRPKKTHPDLQLSNIQLSELFTGFIRNILREGIIIPFLQHFGKLNSIFYGNLRRWSRRCYKLKKLGIVKKDRKRAQKDKLNNSKNLKVAPAEVDKCLPSSTPAPLTFSGVKEGRH